jgi:hypothetical protein
MQSPTPENVFETIQTQAAKRFAFVKTGPASGKITFSQHACVVEYPLWLIRITTTTSATVAEITNDLLASIPSSEHKCGMYLTGVRIADEYVPELAKTKRFVHLACFIVDEWCTERENACGSAPDGSSALVS